MKTLNRDWNACIEIQDLPRAIDFIEACGYYPIVSSLIHEKSVCIITFHTHQLLSDNTPFVYIGRCSVTLKGDHGYINSHTCKSVEELISLHIGGECENCSD